ncbi:cytidylyltransferase domain-containing protein [Pelagicoccus albus]|uniref:NTP transferase domain-containing protein n=1 Tax=Pelagicoccus albus TaxID=415222 RepID=A0A7X1B7P4_9BACT|nr:NTP transferase domain-containing protein [Pelagicoccus albus]MBC2606939.1 NTP transferase domain-containing protein [Pelagicoccus albus]
MKIAMIPARMGSQRLKKKNLRELLGVPLIVRAIQKCQEADCFDEIWVNSEHPDFGPIAEANGVRFHQRPEHLGNNAATSEQYVAEFLETHPCESLFQVHSIAPLLTVKDIKSFVQRMESNDADSLLSVENIQIECALRGEPVNFSLKEKTNSQELDPVQRICWSITAWCRETYLEAARAGKCATYSGRVAMHPVNPLAAHVIKTEEDLAIAEALYPLVMNAC